ncbi:MAG: hypothetical protein M5U32_18970 [Myxococcota bacterium]|nr:hypothetical protein [Myxococcota bacterium]
MNHSSAPSAPLAALARLHPALRTGNRLAEELAQQQREARLTTGLGAVDGLLGGGFPRGRLSEITGPLSSGRTSLAMALAAAATRAGEVVAWIDPADALDPASLDAAGVEANRLLWVRPSGARDALHCAERLLLARGFALVVLDLAGGADETGNRRAARPRPGQLGGLTDARSSAWLRLTRCAAVSATALVLLGREPVAGSFAALAVDLHATRRRFAERPAWLEGLETRVALRRHRFGSTEGFAPVCWKVPPVVPDPMATDLERLDPSCRIAR